MSCLTALFLSLPAFAQDIGDIDVKGLRLGAAFAYGPEYVGSDDYQFRPLPLISFDDLAGFEFNGLALSYPMFEIGTGQGVGKWSLAGGPRANFEFGRDSEDSPTLEGLEDIDASLLAGGYVRGTYGPVGIRIDAGQDIIGGHGGFNTDFAIGTFIPAGIIAERLTIQPALSVSWANTDYTQTVYGVSMDQATASAFGLPEYDVGSGFHRAAATLITRYDLDDRWQVFGVTSYREYLGEYRDSPILRAPDGATSDVFTLVGISRRFGG